MNTLTILLGKVYILHQPQASLELQNPPDLTTVVNEQPSITSTLFRPPGGGNQDPRPAVRRLWIPKGIEQHTEKIDYQDSLQKIEAELQALTTQSRPLQTPVTDRKQLVKLSLIDIYCISTIGFLRNVKQPDTTVFSTSLYKIN